MKKKVIFGAVLLVTVIVVQFAIMHRKVTKSKRSLAKEIKNYKKWTSDKLQALSNAMLYESTSFPGQFDETPNINKKCLLSVKDVQIKDVFAPYNASIIEKENGGYHLFFRYDVVHQMHLNHYNTNIGYAELDKDFNQAGKKFVKINTESPYSEDPRILRAKDNLYLVYNDGPSRGLRGRKMHIAHLDLETFQPQQITTMDPRLSNVEKNWVPFEYQNTIHFEYQVFRPRKVLCLEKSTRATLTNISDTPKIEKTYWEKKWGKPLGGSSARLIDGEYLGFFHSKFKDNLQQTWYVMGAYTFEAKPPFKITSMSKYPILYNGIYRSKPLNTSDPQKFVIFPCGYVIEHSEDKTLLHLACGENDCAIKILSFDKEQLLKTLVPIEGLIQ